MIATDFLFIALSITIVYIQLAGKSASHKLVNIIRTTDNLQICKIISILLNTKRSMKIQMLVGIPKFSIKDGKRVLRPRKK